MPHRSKSVLSNSCLCLNCIRASFSMVMAVFQHPFWLMLSPTFQQLVVLGVTRLKIHFIIPSGVVELMYSRNGNRSLLPWPSNNPKGVGTSWCRSKKLSWSKYLSTSVRIPELIYPLGYMNIKPGNNPPLNLHTGKPGKSIGIAYYQPLAPITWPLMSKTSISTTSCQIINIKR